MYYFAKQKRKNGDCYENYCDLFHMYANSYSLFMSIYSPIDDVLESLRFPCTKLFI